MTASGGSEQASGFRQRSGNMLKRFYFLFFLIPLLLVRHLLLAVLFQFSEYLFLRVKGNSAVLQRNA